jgi:hypothetical protein
MPRFSNESFARFFIVALAIFGWSLTLAIFYPGVMTYDARYVYGAIAEGRAGDWQSPVMTWLWEMIDPIAPGSASMFLLIASLYWLAYGLLGWSIEKSCPRIAILLVIAALISPAFALQGSIWRDVLFANVWLIGCVLAYDSTNQRQPVAGLMRVLALTLVLLGFLLRPNALFAAPLLAAYAVWPARLHWRRVALGYVPALIALYGLMHVVYYGVFDAMRQNPLHSIMVFDIGGVSHFSRENRFPVTWTADENALVTRGCYSSAWWDAYWTQQPCLFVMARLERDKIFGSPQLVEAWKSALTAHPLAYVRHRLAFMRTLLFGDNLTMWTRKLDDPTRTMFEDNPRFQAFKQIHDWVKPTPLFKAATWLLVCAALCIVGWRRRLSAGGLFVLATSGSAIIYTATFLAFGVASDFRYALWAVVAGIAGAAIAACPSASVEPSTSQHAQAR